MSVLRTFARAFKAEFGRPANTNPWPRCGCCYRRTDPAGLCMFSTGHPADTCIGCCPWSGNHPAEEGEEK
jgi:hypothetical protein